MHAHALRRNVSVVLATLTVIACDRPIADPAAPARLPANAVASQAVRVEVRFSDALRVRTANGAIRSQVLQAPMAGFETATRGRLSSLRPLHSASASRLDHLRRVARARGSVMPDPESWYTASVPRSESASLVAALNVLAEVDTAYVAPAAAPLPTTAATEDFTSLQYYFAAAPEAVGLVALRALPGGDGAGVTVVDVEYDWLFGHEDLTLAASSHLGGELYPYFGSDHGTAVLGILGGRNNGFGVTGAAPAARVVTSAPFTDGWYVPADAILRAVAATNEGDVILLEQQAFGPTGAYVPLEWIPSVYEATRAATRAGRIVVAAAGNGAMDLDDPVFGGRFDRTQFNSGAIIVGAAYEFRERLWFSTFGSRVDVQGRGVGVVTTGYGDLFGPSPTTAYTSAFSGTSSASAITAGIITALQGYVKRHLGAPLTADEMANLLKATGTPQSFGVSGDIGPLPNVAAAASQWRTLVPDLVSIDINPRQPENIVVLHGPENRRLTVAILATPTFDPQTLDITTAGLGNASAGFLEPLRDASGAVATDQVDVDHDGDADLVLGFSRDALVASGALSPSTSVLGFRANTLAGVRIRGSDVVRPIS